jgi:hypothetical protein
LARPMYAHRLDGPTGGLVVRILREGVPPSIFCIVP